MNITYPPLVQLEDRDGIFVAGTAGFGKTCRSMAAICRVTLQQVQTFRSTA